MGIKRSVERLIENFDIKIKGFKLDIMGRDRPSQNIDKIGIFIMPLRHSISNGVYLIIKKNSISQDVGFRFSYSDMSKPSVHICEMMDSFDKKYSAVSNISDGHLDKIAKDKILKFIELSDKFNFESMKIKDKNTLWDMGYQIPYKTSPYEENKNIKEKK